MITDFAEVMRQFEIDEIKKEMNKAGDYIGLWLNITNAFSQATLKSFRTNNKQKEYDDNGQLFADKDEFLRMLEEIGIEL